MNGPATSPCGRPTERERWLVRLELVAARVQGARPQVRWTSGVIARRRGAAVTCGSQVELFSPGSRSRQVVWFDDLDDDLATWTTDRRGRVVGRSWAEWQDLSDEERVLDELERLLLDRLPQADAG